MTAFDIIQRAYMNDLFKIKGFQLRLIEAFIPIRTKSPYIVLLLERKSFIRRKGDRRRTSYSYLLYDLKQDNITKPLSYKYNPFISDFPSLDDVTDSYPEHNPYVTTHIMGLLANLNPVFEAYTTTGIVTKDDEALYIKNMQEIKDIMHPSLAPIYDYFSFNY